MSAGEPYYFNQFPTSYAGIPHTKCECHECTQARWKMSLQVQIYGAQRGLGAQQEQCTCNTNVPCSLHVQSGL